MTDIELEFLDMLENRVYRIVKMTIHDNGKNRKANKEFITGKLTLEEATDALYEIKDDNENYYYIADYKDIDYIAGNYIK